MITGQIVLGNYSILKDLSLDNTHIVVFETDENSISKASIEGCYLVNCDLRATRWEYYSYTVMVNCLVPDTGTVADAVNCKIRNDEGE